MNDKIFIDTNLFVYSVDDGEPAKQVAAKNIISEIVRKWRRYFHASFAGIL